LNSTNFNVFFDKYGIWDYTMFSETWGFIRYRYYNDGAWLEGYNVEPVVYWGA